MSQSNKECNLILEISLNSQSPINKDLYLETTIKSISSVSKYPSYLIKNKINREYLNYKSPNYYFTDIGQKISKVQTIILLISANQSLVK